MLPETTLDTKVRSLLYRNSVKTKGLDGMLKPAAETSKHEERFVGEKFFHCNALSKETRLP